MRGRGTWRLAAAAALVLAALSVPVPGARAEHVGCGDVLTADTTLDSELLDCPANGVEILAAGVTLDLGGHTIDGVGRGLGVATGSAASNVTITNGAVREFNDAIKAGPGSGYVVRDVSLSDSHDGLLFFGAADSVAERVSAWGNGSGIITPVSNGITLVHNHVFANEAGIGGVGFADSQVVHNLVEDNKSHGISFTDMTGTTLEHNVARGNGTFGIALGEASAGNRVAHNRVARSGSDGVALSADAGPNVLERNRSHMNADDGFDVAAAGTTLIGNSAFSNGDLGFEVPLGAFVARGNKARRNGNPQQCLGIPCR
jgi:parallel beta-helix repeat protein